MSMLGYYMALQKKASSGALLFDVFGIADAGFALHRLSSDFNSEVVMVHRSDAVGDFDGFGFVNDELDTASIASFIASTGQGRLGDFINQGSVATSFAQTDWTKMPRLYVDGVLQTDGGKPCLKFDGGQVLSAGDNFNDYPQGTVEDVTFMTASVGSMLSDANVLHGKISIAGLQSQQGVVRNAGNDYLLSDGTFIGDIAKNGRALYSTKYDSVPPPPNSNRDITLDSFYVDNVQKGTSNYLYRGINTYHYLIGAGYVSGGEFWHLNGKFQELIICKDLTANIPSMSDLNTAIMTYYGIS